MLLEQMFEGRGKNNQPGFLSMRAQLSVPVVGIGAPAASFYPPISNFLDVEVVVPEHAEVANAVGAVVGVVKQAVQLTITPVSGKRVMVHAPHEQREFDSLEPAASWAIEVASEAAFAKAEQAGARQIEVAVDRKDNIVEHQGQTTFFESTIIATASGRAGGNSSK